MSSGGYRQHRDGRYRRGRPLSRSPLRDQWSKPISRSRAVKHASDLQGSTRTATRKKSPDFFLNANLDDVPIDIGTDDSDSPLQNSIPDSESSSDHDGTPIPDHVWVGEYLDEGEDKDTVPLPYHTYAKEIAYKKAMSEVLSSAGPDFMNPNRLLRDYEYFSSAGRYALPPMHGSDAFQRREGELMPPPMPRIGVTDSMTTNQTLKRYHKLYKALNESMEYRAEHEKKKHSELMGLARAIPLPAEVYDYGHGENRASTSREKRERKKSTESSGYGTKSQGALCSPLNFQDTRGRARYDDSEKRKHRAVVEPIRPTQRMEPKKSVTTESSSSSQRFVIPTTTFTFEEFCKLQGSHSAMDVPSTSSTRSDTPATNPFTFQELCHLQKALSRHSSSIPPTESEDSYIPVPTSLANTSKESSQEGFPIKVLTTSCRARRNTTKDKEEFSRGHAGKSGESRQLIAQVTPLRIKPILKVNRDTKTGTLKKDSPEKMGSYYQQNSTYRGSFNDTRKVLLDAAKELESRSSKEQVTGPRIVVRNPALADSLLQAALPFHMKRHSPDETFTAHRSDQKEFVESLFPFHKSRPDSGKKSDDSDDEVEMIRYKKLGHSPSPKRRRRIHSRSRSPSARKKPRGTRSRSLSPRPRYRGKRNRVSITPPRQYSSKRSRSGVAPQRSVMPTDKSEKDISEFLGRDYYKDEDSNKYGEARALDDGHRRMLRDMRSVDDNSRSKLSHSFVDRHTGRAEDFCSAGRSPVTNIDIRHGKRENSRSLSRHSGISVDKDRRERSSSGLKNSPHYSQIEASLSPERHEILNSGKQWQVRSRNQPARDCRIQISQSPEKEGKSGSGQRLYLLPDSRWMAVSGHAQQFHTPERSASSPKRRVYSDSVQQHKEPSLERQVRTSHFPSRHDSKITNPYEKSHRPIKRALRSKSRSAERMIPHFTNRKRSSLLTDKTTSELSSREVYRQRRYKHEAMDSIIQEEDIPRLLDVEVSPLPSLMDVDVSAKPDVKIKDERRFTSRSTSKERVTPTTISKIIFQGRQAKKIITNPNGKIVLTRKDETKPQRGEAKLFLAKGKATASPGKGLVRKTAKAKSAAMLADAKVKTEAKTVGGAISSAVKPNLKFPLERPAVKMESVEKAIHLKRPRKDEWLEDYKIWFQQTMYQVLQDSEQAKELGFQEPSSFLDSVTKGIRRSLSFVPRGKAAKEILKFIALNKKSIDESYNKETCQTMLEGGKKKEGKITAKFPEEIKAGAGDSIGKTNAPSTDAVEDVCEQGNKFFLIDKKPTEAQIGAISAKKIDKGDEKGALKKVIPPQKSLQTKEEVGVQKKVVKMPTDKKSGVVKKSKVKSSFIKYDRSTDLPKPASASVHSVKSTDPGAPPHVVCHTTNLSSHDNVTALQTDSDENTDIYNAESTPTDPIVSTDQNISKETGPKSLNKPKTLKETKFRSGDSKWNSSGRIMRRKPIDGPSDKPVKPGRHHIEIPKTEPNLTPEQESLLPAFKRQIEKSVSKNLNILYKLEKYKKYKIKNVANEALDVFNFASVNMAAGFTFEHALYYIRRLFENPSKDALDDLKRHMRKVDLEEPCFDINLKTFFFFQSTVYDLCRQNLNSKVRYQDHSRIKHVHLSPQHHFPQFDGEAQAMMKMWTWRERMYSIAQKNTVHSSSAHLKPFPDDGDFNSMEESVAKWLKMVTNLRIYNCPEGSSCDLIYEVKRQLMKRKAHATRQEAIMLIARAWTRNYYYKIEKKLLRNSRPRRSEEKVESSDHDELMVLDEVYSSESDSGDNTEDSIVVTDDLSGVQIDLF